VMFLKERIKKMKKSKIYQDIYRDLEFQYKIINIGGDWKPFWIKCYWREEGTNKWDEGTQIFSGDTEQEAERELHRLISIEEKNRSDRHNTPICMRYVSGVTTAPIY
ncbi:MAG: hypothetical protein ABIC04_07865, partial [Nanoarchaeota archaeon]